MTKRYPWKGLFIIYHKWMPKIVQVIWSASKCERISIMHTIFNYQSIRKSAKFQALEAFMNKYVWEDTPQEFSKQSRSKNHLEASFWNNHPCHILQILTQILIVLEISWMCKICWRWESFETFNLYWNSHLLSWCKT